MTMNAVNQKIIDICENAYENVKELIVDFDLFYCALRSRDTLEISFPLVKENDLSVARDWNDYYFKEFQNYSGAYAADFYSYLTQYENSCLNYKPRQFDRNVLPDLAIETLETIKTENGKIVDSLNNHLVLWPQYSTPPRSTICSPMIAGDKVVGALLVEKRSGKNGFVKSSTRVLDEIAQQVAITIDRALLFERLEEKTKAQEAVQDISVKLTEGIQLGEEKILELIKEYADRVMDTDNMYIALYEQDPAMPDVFDPGQPNNCRVHGKVRFGLMYVDGKPKEMPVRKAVPGKYGRTEVILATREPILNRTREESEAWYELPGHENFLAGGGAKGTESFAGWLGVPMVVSGKPIGVIATYHRAKEYLYDKDDQQVLTMMASQAATAIENSWLYQNLEDKVKQRTEQLQEKNEKLKRVNTELSKAREREIMAIIGEVASGLIHKISNNLGFIPYTVDQLLAELGPKRGKTTKDQLTRIKVGVENFLSYSQNMTKIYELKEVTKELIQIDLLIEDAQRFILPDPMSYNVKLIKDYGEKTFNTYANPSLMSEVFQIIIKNAIESMPSGGTLSIRIAENCSNSDHGVSIEISDTGCGIPKEKHPNVFQAGFSTKKEGKGIGLWFCGTVIKQHQGRIHFRSEEDIKGTSFYILLPTGNPEHKSKD